MSSKTPATPGYDLRLSSLEFELMAAIWRHAGEPLSGAAIYALVDPEQRLTYSTIITYLYRLEDRGWLTSKRDGAKRLFKVAREPDDYAARLAGRLARIVTKRRARELLTAARPE